MNTKNTFGGECKIITQYLIIQQKECYISALNQSPISLITFKDDFYDVELGSNGCALYNIIFNKNNTKRKDKNKIINTNKVIHFLFNNKSSFQTSTYIIINCIRIIIYN